MSSVLSRVKRKGLHLEARRNLQTHSSQKLRHQLVVGLHLHLSWIQDDATWEPGTSKHPNLNFWDVGLCEVHEAKLHRHLQRVEKGT